MIPESFLGKMASYSVFWMAIAAIGGAMGLTIPPSYKIIAAVVVYITFVLGLVIVWVNHALENTKPPVKK